MLRKLLNQSGMENESRQSLSRQVIDYNLVPTLVSLMGKCSEPHYQLEASWCLATLSSCQTRNLQATISDSLVKKTTTALCNPYKAIFEQAAWIIAKLSENSPKVKIMFLQSGCYEILIDKMQHGETLKEMKLATWALSNLIRGPKGMSRFQPICLKPMMRMVKKSNDVEILHQLLTTIGDLFDHQWVVFFSSEGLLGRLAEIVKLSYKSILVPTIRILKHYSAAEESYTQELIDQGFVKVMFEWLVSDAFDKENKPDLLWILSNITIGPQNQKNAVFDSPQRWKILERFCYDQDVKISREAVYLMCNTTHQCSYGVKQVLIDQGFLRIMHHHFEIQKDEDTISIMLEALDNILQSGKSLNFGNYGSSYQDYLDDMGILDDLEGLGNHDSNDIYQKVCKIGDQYLEEEDDFQ